MVNNKYTFIQGLVTSSNADKMYQVEQIEGKGTGCTASEKIKPGTLIINHLIEFFYIDMRIIPKNLTRCFQRTEHRF